MDKKIHFLKISPKFFELTLNGLKNWEIRKNDRDYKVGDFLELEEYCTYEYGYTGRSIFAEITYVFNDFGLEKGYIILSIMILYYNFLYN